MKTLQEETAELIDNELNNIPEKYQKNFNSTHEGYAVILEEVRELENEVFFGEKKAKAFIEDRYNTLIGKETSDKIKDEAYAYHRARMREECVQIAAMCARFIQELT